MFDTLSSTSSSTLSHPLYEAQIELEERMLVVGRENFYKQIEDAKRRGEEAGTGYGMKLIRQLILPVSEAINDFITKANTGGAGRRHTALRFMELLDGEVLAFLTLKTVLDSITLRQSLQRAALRVAYAVQDEVRLIKFKEANPDKFKLTMKRVDEATTRRHKERVARIMANRAGVNLDWSDTDMVHLGQKLIEILKDATGLVSIVRETHDVHDTSYMLIATDDTLAWIENANEHMEALSPAFMPTIIPPKPWTSPFEGGYHSGLVRWMPLVKTGNRNFLEELANRDMSEVYAAVNAMQDTPWRINTRVLDVLKQAWETGAKVKSLPPRENDPLPPKPHDIATNEDAKKDWKKRAAKVHQRNAKLKSKRIQFRKIIQLAEQFAPYEEHFYVYQLDFRGRVYAVPMFLHPQGPDHAKALLTFASGKRIGDGVAAGWLAIHGANTYGYDKVSLEERVAWVEERNDVIASIAADPWGPGFDLWSKADKPWQFLAFCFEWAGFLREGFDYVSSLPVALDGSCNGLQHYSAALRDPVGGAAVNLVPADKPNDIYGTVAKVALELVEGFACLNGSSLGTIPEKELVQWRKTWEKHGLDERELAVQWLHFGIDRKVTKRSVMTLPYGSTQYSCREFLEEAVREKIEEGKPNSFASGEVDGVFKATMWLQPIVWFAIGRVVKAAREGMDWLKDCARLAAAEGLPVTWETPDGFLVQQSYRDTSQKRIKTHLDGQIIKLSIREEKPTIDKRRQQQGIAPNWVHSMDATAMRMFINLATANGIQHFALVHDSYGTVAADVEMMSACLKKGFVQLYTERDPLAEFRVDIAAMLSDEALPKLPQLPEKGTLDVRQVEESDFFFA